MARRVFLHIGAPKTGTTYLQQVMHHNRSSLRAQGVLYASGKFPQDRVWSSEIARGVSHSGRARAAGAWRRIVAQAAAWDGDAVISHEFFCACNEEQARSVIADLAPATVHVVLTARDYARQQPAAWQERLKFGGAIPFSEFTLDGGKGMPLWSWRTQDLVAILERWSAGVTPERVHVVTVPPPGTPGNLLWTRFATVLGVDPDSCDTDVAFANTSLGVVEAELLRRVGERLPKKFADGRVAAAWVRNLLANDVLAARRGERLALSPMRFDELAKASQDAANAISEAHYDVVGDVADLVPAPAAAGRTPDEVSEHELLDTSLDTIAELLSAMETRERRRRTSPQRRPRSLLEAARGSEAPSVRLTRSAVARVRRLRRSG